MSEGKNAREKERDDQGRKERMKVSEGQNAREKEGDCEGGRERR